MTKLKKWVYFSKIDLSNTTYDPINQIIISNKKTLSGAVKPAHGKSSMLVECPLRATESTVYLWSFYSAGKKCAGCGATLSTTATIRLRTLSKANLIELLKELFTIIGVNSAYHMVVAYPKRYKKEQILAAIKTSYSELTKNYKNYMTEYIDSEAKLARALLERRDNAIRILGLDDFVGADKGEDNQ